MNPTIQSLFPFVAALAGTLIFWLVSRLLLKNLHFQLGKGHYVGGLPQIGTLIGILAFAGLTNVSRDFKSIILVSIVLALFGFIRDIRKVSNQGLMAFILLIYLTFFYLIGLPTKQLLFATAWSGLIFVCLKIAALVYEMPFILTATSSLTMLVFLSQNSHSAESILLTWSVLSCAIVFLLHSSTGKRALTGSSGLLASGFLLSTISVFENSGKLMLFGLFLPSMVILFPTALISFVIVASYFGNRLHDQSKPARLFNWSLEREKMVVFSGLIFLCLNFLGILVEFKAPLYGYLALFTLLIAALTGFFRTFARKEANAFEPKENIEILGVKIAPVTPDEVIARIYNHITDKSDRGMLHVVTADSLALLRNLEEERFKNVLSRAELVIPDGAGIVWASDFIGTPLPARVPGVALVSSLCQHCEENGFKVFFLGGKPGILEQAVKKIQEKSPDLKIAGIRHGYFQPESAEEDAIMEQIVTSEADVVFVALGVPRQEWFISRFRPAAGKCVAIGVGGSFDVISETLPRAPIWMQRFAIEWLFRLWLEPFRIGRILKIPLFVLQILRYKWNRED